MADIRQIAIFVGGAVLTGGVVGMVTTPNGRAAMVDAGQTLRAASDMRERAPQAGDYWAGCNDARAAGTAPIYRGEPGYRKEMDGDSDGIACEPYR
ncbi:excalibur calcium-binding domain-containing protein [Croceicoccus sp. Ery15]|uniref:excalibur calcium-binding domain-containing protein n=1 Tax=Croceicoccus sp. Ery15 TaxID=1703338 RepID=UPI001E3BED59|nr:excalibur calcium-binding domain-containing protein [Croceicoccus sp. Ery15]